MDFSRFFIDRPIFAAVLSIVIFAAGLIAIPLLPISEYPEVVPPSVVVRTVYPGANPKVIAETVATPLEEAINGVEDMTYLKSVAGSDGVLQMTVTFRPGTDADDAAVRVQNRVAQALARLPEDVRRQGVTTQKQSPVFLMVVHLVSTDGKYDTLYLRNYMRLHVKDELARLPGVGDAQIFGGGDYAMRIWLDPDKVASRGLTAGDVVRAVREQNIQVSAGQLGAEPMPSGSDFLTLINAKGRLSTTEEFGDIVLKSGADGEIVRLADVARLELAAGDYTLRARLDGKEAAAIGIFQAPGANALEIRDATIARMEELSKRFPPGIEYRVDLRHHHLRARFDQGGGDHPAGSGAAGRAGGDPVPADLARLDHPADRGAGVDRRHVRRAVRARLLDQHLDAVRAGAGDRHRRRRRDRGGGERRAQHRGRPDARSPRRTRR